LALDDFRYDAGRGGGALNDLGPYAAAGARYFFAAEPREVHCSALAFRASAGVETAFAVTALFDDGGCFSGQFGFDTEYRNWIDAAGPGGSLRMDRVFTPPPDLACAIDVRGGNVARTVPGAAGDCFARMISRVLERIRDRDPHELYGALLRDSLFRDRMRAAMTEAG
jgi:predicted dehydrogenase